MSSTVIPVHTACHNLWLSCIYSPCLRMSCCPCRCQVVERRARFACEGAKKRLHLVEGFLKAMAALDGVIKVIRGAQDSADASAQLQQGFNLSSEQAEGMLNMSLRRLTSLEAQKLEDEAQKLRDRSAATAHAMSAARSAPSDMMSAEQPSLRLASQQHWLHLHCSRQSSLLPGLRAVNPLAAENSCRERGAPSPCLGSHGGQAGSLGGRCCMACRV